MSSRAPTRTPKQITGVTIHHSASARAENISELKEKARAWDSLHKKKSYALETNGKYGYKYISYHYLIADNGDVLQTQDTKFMRHHAGDGSVFYKHKNDSRVMNKYGIAICFVGYFHPPQNHKLSDAQVKAAATLIYRWEKKYKVSLFVRGHKEVSQSVTACPGDTIGTSKKGKIKEIINLVNTWHKQGKPEDKVDEVQKKLNKLESDIEDLKKALSTVTAERDKLKEEVNSLIKVNSNLLRDNEALSDEISKLKARIENMDPKEVIIPKWPGIDSLLSYYDGLPSQLKWSVWLILGIFLTWLQKEYVNWPIIQDAPAELLVFVNNGITYLLAMARKNKIKYKVE